MSARKAPRRAKAQEGVCPSTQWSHGALLAVAMLAEIQDDDLEPHYVIEDDYRERGTPQRNLVFSYLPRLRNDEQRAGFSAILTHSLVMMLRPGGGPPVLEWLELLATLPHQQARSEFTRRNERRSKEWARKHAANTGAQP